ncbi:GntR family transcriptional regulator [Rhodobacteraceae bacterium RKSG542]|uniref:GntR family transcriptional regulator n=1 Tax=Pseudovibrio flavus TaxID=2529854 RepID=UPI0012BBE62F|nr:GntR family transcriptional regulator [Pseudovibrio flavus]MTI17673.1 GntR family transcriptional regulator [Pseudovibrio flavus]
MTKKTQLDAVTAAFAASKEATIGAQVYSSLKKAIVQLHLKPGNSLSEAEVAKQLGVSRQPVREAFIKLSDVGLVEIRPQRGTYVVLISKRDVENARFLREAIEVAIVRKAALMDTAKLDVELQRLIELQQIAAKHNDTAEFIRLDEAFHQAIADGVDCGHGWRVVMDMKAQMDRVRYLSLEDATPLSTLITQHMAVADAIAKGDAPDAEDSMRGHLREIMKSLPEISKGHPDLFTD